MKRLIIIFTLMFLINCYAQEVNIFFTSDTHGRLLPTIIEGVETGGSARSGKLIKMLRKKHPESLLIDCGDIFHGAFVNDNFKGKPIIDIMNTLKYDLYLPGNHDFGHGATNLKDLCLNSDFYTIGTNIHAQDCHYIFPYRIYNINGIKLGFVSTLTPTTNLSVAGKKMENTIILPPDETLPYYIELLKKKGVDKIILISHTGLEEDKMLAKKFAPDFILGGHSHSTTTLEERVNDTIIMHPGNYYDHVGHLRLTKDDYRFHLYPVDERYLQKDPQIEELIQHYKKIVDTKLDRVIAYNDAMIKPSREVEYSDLFYYINRTLEKAANCDFAQINNNGIRNVLPEGEITVRDIYNILPFGNQAWIVKVKGQNLVDDNWIIKYKDIQPGKVYKVIINSYLGEKNDTFREMSLEKVELEDTIRDVLVKYLEKTGKIIHQ